MEVGPIKAGPKAAVSDSPLPFKPRSDVESERCLAFVDKFLRVPKGTNSRGKLHLRIVPLGVVDFGSGVESRVLINESL
ncbi:hypothetical protein GCM10023217_15280 [Gordonia alkaliphila]|uniref:Uncharacterized protein n=1 Tax=Gordonia alkaliphila TaxID=1053547 RepID=A0ABP8Z5I8_9ACTN